jgi:hypothetical protein
MPTLLKFRGPWKGQSAKAQNLIGPEFAVATQNVVLFNEEIQKPPYVQIKNDLRPGNYYMMGIFPGGGAQQLLPFYWDGANIYWGNTAGTPFSWDAGHALSTASFGGTSYVIYNNKLYFCTNSGVGVTNNRPDTLVSVDTALTITNPAANYLGGCFISQLADHLVMANCGNTAGSNFPNRVAWSATGLPLVWDPTVNVNAGFSDLSSIADYIVGLANIDKYLAIFSHNNIVWMIPTGNGLQPFTFQQLANAGQTNTIGAAYGQSIDSNGQFCIFVSNYDVHMLTLNGLVGIGGDARNDIFADLALANPQYNAVRDFGLII